MFSGNLCIIMIDLDVFCEGVDWVLGIVCFFKFDL